MYSFNFPGNAFNVLKSNTGLLLLLCILFCHRSLISQEVSYYTPDQLFKEVVFRIDTMEYKYPWDKVKYSGRDHLPFMFSVNDPVGELIIYPREAINADGLILLPSGDFTIIDSLRMENNSYYRAKIRFQKVTESELLSFRFEANTNFMNRPVTFHLELFPYTQSYLHFYPTTDELFVGEEKVFELVTNNIENIIADEVWYKGKGIDHRLIREGDKLKLYLVGTATGSQDVNLEVKLKRPILDNRGNPTYDLPAIRHTFDVLTSPLSYLAIDRSDVVMSEESRSGIEVQLDYNSNLVEGKTYRIEGKENPGGALIAEIFTRNRLSNGKMLCWLRIFNLHKRSDGYLYIKDGDKARFLTNFNIVPQTRIDRVILQREGRDPSLNLQIFPGETIEVKIEGVSLNRTSIRFEDISSIQKDTLLRGENTLLYRIKIPDNIPRKRLNIYNDGVSTGFFLDVKEYQKARPLDFLMLNYEENGVQKNITFNKVSSAIMHGSSLKDVVITPIRSRIDDEGQIHGKQYLEIKVTLVGTKREMIEMRTIDNIVICPDQNSPRFLYYRGQDCLEGSISINSFLSRKTNELEDWSRVEIEIRHRADKHDDEIYSHRVEFILSRKYDFDIDVSFPAGLVQLRPGTPVGDQLSTFSGVSLAALAQFSFFRPGKVRQFLPYRVGVGTIAMNAFDFSSDNDNRGLALVALGSLSPTRRDPKLRLTLYFGGGYFLTNSDNVRSPPGWFLLIGPGIAVRL